MLYDQSTIELPAGAIEAALEAVDTELSDNYDFPEPPEEQPSEEQPEAEAPPEREQRTRPESEPPQPAERSQASEEAARRAGFKETGGELEARVKDIVKAEGARDETGAPHKLGVTLIALLIVAVLVFAVICLVKYMRAPIESDSTLILDYISGQWLSEPFVYADDPSHGYVEVLGVNPDGTFTLTHLEPDPRNENGYKDGSWPVDYRISGEVEIFADEKCVMLKYSEFGKEYYIDRYIVKMEEDALALREFYDEEMKESYDIVYKRIDNASAQTPAEGSAQTTQQTQATGSTN